MKVATAFQLLDGYRTLTENLIIDGSLDDFRASVLKAASDNDQVLDLWRACKMLTQVVNEVEKDDISSPKPEK